MRPGLLALATGIDQQAAGQAGGLSRQAVSQLRRFDGPQRAALTALACTPAPMGHSCWTLRLLADKAVELALMETIFHETVSQMLKKTSCSLTANSIGAWGR